MTGKWTTNITAAFMIIISSTPAIAWITEQEKSASQKGLWGCIGCAAFIASPFVLLFQDSVNMDETTIDINGTKVRVVKESIKKYPDGTISSAAPLEQSTITVDFQKITFSYEHYFNFYRDGSLESGTLQDYAELLVGSEKITFGCTLGSDCEYCSGFDRLNSRYIFFHKNGTIRLGTITGKSVFRVEGRTYTLKHPDCVEFDPDGRPVKGFQCWKGNKVYFQTKDFQEYNQE